jgi:hypothetical protein
VAGNVQQGSDIGSTASIFYAIGKVEGTNILLPPLQKFDLSCVGPIRFAPLELGGYRVENQVFCR